MSLKAVMEEDFVVFKVTGIEKKNEVTGKKNGCIFFKQSLPSERPFVSAESWMTHPFDLSCPGKYVYQHILY